MACRIPFERALDFANKEKITEQLYPLFVHNIGGLLYHPTNENRTSAVVAATERRQRLDSVPSSRNGQSQPPALHHHHSMSSTVGSHVAPPAPHSIAPHPGAGRPGIDRAHTFPTPPTSASSVMGMGNQGSSYEWGGQGIANGVAGTQPLSIDTGLGNAPRSMPTTPATTPPGSSMQSMQSYPGQQSFDNSKSYYSAPPSSQNVYAQQSGVAQQNMARYGQPMASSSYGKNDMGPPSAPGTGNTSDPDQHDIKTDQYAHAAGNGHLGHSVADTDTEHQHDNGYMHTNSSAYSSNRNQYAYHPGSDHPHLSPEMTSSPSHQTASGRGTPRNATGAQPQWSQGYHTPPRSSQSSNLYNVMSDSRRPNGNPSGETYTTSTYTNPTLNGTSTSMKRSREDDDQDQGGRPDSRGIESGFDLKRRKIIRQENMGATMGAIPNMQSIKTGGGLSRQR